MDNEISLAGELQECRDRLYRSESLYNELVAHLRSNAVGDNSPCIGEGLEEFALPNTWGKLRTLNNLLASGPIVLCFIRGRWCPYCRAELAMWAIYESLLSAAHARLVVVTAETSSHVDTLREIVGQDVEILQDANHGLALKTGLAFWCGTKLLKIYQDNGLDLTSIYGNSSGLMTIPATYLVDRKALVRYAFADPDFRNRAEPSEVVRVLNRIR